MRRAYDQFTENIQYIRELEALHNHLANNLKLPNDISDLLRAQWVYSVSALDKLIHELIRIGMLESFAGIRHTTDKFKAFPISTNAYLNIKSATIPPPEYFFEQEIVQKHKILTFQDPDKIVEGLSLIWAEEHKLQKISDVMLISKQDIRIRLKNIINRRNQIVHEADINPLTNNKESINVTDTQSTINFIERICEVIFNFVL